MVYGANPLANERTSVFLAFQHNAIYSGSVSLSEGDLLNLERSLLSVLCILRLRR